MNCINKDCENIKFCKKAHELNGLEFGVSPEVTIPDAFFYILNFNNRFAKRGLPKEGFQFGCMKLIESSQNCYSLYVNDKYMIDYEFNELVQCCNEAFSAMIKSGEIKLG